MVFTNIVKLQSIYWILTHISLCDLAHIGSMHIRSSSLINLGTIHEGRLHFPRRQL